MPLLAPCPIPPSPKSRRLVDSNGELNKNEEKRSKRNQNRNRVCRVCAQSTMHARKVSPTCMNMHVVDCLYFGGPEKTRNKQVFKVDEEINKWFRNIECLRVSHVCAQVDIHRSIERVRMRIRLSVMRLGLRERENARDSYCNSIVWAFGHQETSIGCHKTKNYTLSLQSLNPY